MLLVYEVLSLKPHALVRAALVHEVLSLKPHALVHAALSCMSPKPVLRSSLTLKARAHSCIATDDKACKHLLHNMYHYAN